MWQHQDLGSDAMAIHDLVDSFAEVVHEKDLVENAEAVHELLLLAWYLFEALVPYYQSKNDYFEDKNRERKHSGIFGLCIPAETAKSMANHAMDIEQRAAIVLDHVYEIWRTAEGKPSVKRIEGNRT